MRSDVWHLHPINIVVPANHTIEPVLPVHCHKWIAVIIVEKKSGMTVNHLLQLWWLPAIMIKSVVLVLAACLAAKHFGKVSFLGVLLAVLAYQFVGTVFEWMLTQNLHIALQDIRLGFPGIIIQIVGGFLVLNLMSRD